MDGFGPVHAEVGRDRIKAAEQISAQCGPSTTRGCVPRCRRPDVRRHARWPQSWIQRENWEFETHRAGWATLGTWTSNAAALPKARCAVEMATGTGKTRTAVAFVKRLFEAGVVTRVLFLVDRIALAAARLPSIHAVAPRRFLSRLVRHDWLRRCRPLRDL